MHYVSQDIHHVDIADYSHNFISLVSAAAKRVLAAVGNVKEAVVFLVVLVDFSHQSRYGRERILHKDEDCLLRVEFDVLTDEVDELADGQIARHQELCLARLGDHAVLGPRENHRDSIGVLFAEASSVAQPPLERIVASDIFLRLMAFSQLLGSLCGSSAALSAVEISSKPRRHGGIVSI